ncbi:MAG: DNA-directed RNA polymerase subunit beta', partial [Nitrospirae bacterium]|nr:DNA-directed RNA polymerase subunit beta' [Nitrospirota bacterium]
LLNRAPTLHRLGIQAFDPVLVEGKAIRLHPLVCTAFNADFDGDQMAVHVPLSVEAQVEARVLMMSVNNILSPANGKPIMLPTQDMVLGLYYMTKAKKGARGEGRIFANPGEVRVAYDAHVVDLHARIKARIDRAVTETTVGRVLLFEVLPPQVPFSAVNQVMTKKEIGKLVDRCYRDAGPRATVVLLDVLKEVGFRFATTSGISICINDMSIPSKKDALINQAHKEVMEVHQQYGDGLITNGERYNKVIDIWAKVTERVAHEMMGELGAESDEKIEQEEKRSFNSIFMMADSGARGSAQQIQQLGGMRGLMAKPSGEIIETPITANFREGLTVLQYFISTHGARKGLADTALKTANSGYLTRRLVDVSQDVIVGEVDCGTTDGIVVTALVEGGEIIEPLGERLLGRTVSEDVRDPVNREIIVPAGAEVDEDVTHRIDDLGLDQVKIRSVLTCHARRGVCARCYGRDLGRGRRVEIGEAVGVMAAQSIGEPGTQLTMRTFHIGGTASKVAVQTGQDSRHDGRVRYVNLATVRNKEGDMIVMNRNAQLVVQDETGREREKYSVVYGAKLKVEDGVRVKPGQRLVEWDPYSLPFLAEVGGRIAFGDIEEGVTVREEVDEVTGLSHKVIIDYPADRRPRISIVEKNQGVAPGDILAKIPRETTKTKDITGGLPRVAELFEARKPKEQAVISEIDGTVEFGGFVKGMRRVIVKGPVGDEKEYFIPKGKHVNVREGDFVRAGEPLMDGSVNPHDILDVLGPKELQKYLVDEVQKVYRLQGVSINDKHIEIIVRQMLKKVRIEDSGDTDFLVGDQVDRFTFQAQNEAMMAAEKVPATGRPVLLGITKASLTTDSFVSAASFQETTRVLTEAAITGSVDELLGLKENVIMGRLIPAGTGLLRYRDTFPQPKERLVEEAVSAPEGA